MMTATGNDRIVSDARQLASGTIATLSGERNYQRIDEIQAAFVEFVSGRVGQFEDWQDAWHAFFGPKVTKVVDGRIATVRVGSAIELESGRCEKLLPSDWEKASFRFPHPIREWQGKHDIAINVEITGRTFQTRYNGDYYVKVRIEWVGDGEPSTYCGGWMFIENPWNLPYANETAA